MVDIATLGIAVKSDQVKAASRDLDAFKGAAGRASAANDNLAAAAKRMASGMSVAKVAAGAMAAGLATAGLALRKFLGATGEAQEAQAQLAARLKSTGGAAGRSVEQLNAHAAALQKITTFGDEAINSAQALLLTFTKIQGGTFDRATKTILDMSIAMGQDLKSSAIQLGKALNDPIQGVSALSRVGVQFSEGQKTMIKSMVEAGNVAGAQALILGELETQMGGAAEAARNTLPGALDAMKNAWGDAFELSGQDTNKLKDEVNKLSDAFGSDEFKRFVQTIGITLVSGLTTAVGLALRLNAAMTQFEKNRLDKVIAYQEKQLGRVSSEYRTGQLARSLKKLYEERRALDFNFVDPAIPAAANAIVPDETVKPPKPEAQFGGTGGGGKTKAETEAERTAAAIQAASGALSEFQSITAETGLIVPRVNALTGEFEALSIELGDLPEVYDRAAVAAREFTGGLVRDMIRAGSATDALALGLSRVLERLADTAMQDALSGIFGGIGGGSGGGFWGGIGKALGFRAFGGPVAGGSPYIVGERGPELFIPRQGGQIVANDRMGGSGGQQQVMVTVAIDRDSNDNLNVAVRNVAQSTVRQAAPSIVAQSVATTRANFRAMNEDAGARGR